MDACKLHHNFCGFSKEFVIDGQHSEVLLPWERAFHNPAFGQYLKFRRIFVRSEHDLLYPSESLLAPVSQTSPVAYIRQDFSQTRKFISEFLYGLWGALAVMQAGFMDCDGQRKAERIDYEVIFPSLDLLVPVYTTVRINMMGSPYPSEILDAKTGDFLPSRLFTEKRVHGFHHLFKHACKLPLEEVVIDRLPRGEVWRKHTPLAASLVDVKDGIHYLFKRMFAAPRLRL